MQQMSGRRTQEGAGGMIPLVIPLVVLAVNAVRDIRTKTVFPFMIILTAVAGLVYGCIRSKSAIPFAGLIPGGIILLFWKAGGGKIGAGDGLAVCAEGAWNGAVYAAAGLFAGLAGVVIFETMRRVTEAVLAEKKLCDGRDADGRLREIAFIPFLFFGYLAVALLQVRTG